MFVKASAGGGGKGMRLVTDRKELESSVREAIGEAKAFFGDDTVFVEKKVENPRHIEFQILADNHGNVVHLFERECSIQRRHQKVLEETPSSALNDDLRKRMGDAAVNAARATGYVSAGTIEFILGDDGEFYFLEMNTRIQVEHPITELTTGVDLVQWQLRVAAGEKLSFTQDDLKQTGHAIECRIYAEDATQNFMPSCGLIRLLQVPGGPGIRDDSGVYEGWEVSPHYDPMLSKLIVYAEDRKAAIARMRSALGDYVVHGVKTSVALHRRILESKDFISGNTTTAFLENNADLLQPPELHITDDVIVAAVLADQLVHAQRKFSAGAESASDQTWQRVGRWEIGGRA